MLEAKIKIKSYFNTDNLNNDLWTGTTKELNKIEKAIKKAKIDYKKVIVNNEGGYLKFGDNTYMNVYFRETGITNVLDVTQYLIPGNQPRTVKLIFKKAVK